MNHNFLLLMLVFALFQSGCGKQKQLSALVSPTEINFHDSFLVIVTETNGAIFEFNTGFYNRAYFSEVAGFQDGVKKIRIFKVRPKSHGEFRVSNSDYNTIGASLTLESKVAVLQRQD